MMGWLILAVIGLIIIWFIMFQPGIGNECLNRLEYTKSELRLAIERAIYADVVDIGGTGITTINDQINSYADTLMVQCRSETAGCASLINCLNGHINTLNSWVSDV